LSAMAGFELLRVTGFAEGAAEGRVEEEGVVTEAVGAAGIVDDAPFDRAAIDAAQAVAFDEGDHADESGCAIFDAAELFEQAAVVGLVGCVRSTEPRREDTGGTAERVDFKTRVVGEKQAGGVAPVVTGLEDGVCLESIAVFDAGLEVAEAGKELDLDGRVSRG